MAEEAMREVRTSFTSQADLGHRDRGTKFRADEFQECFGPIEVRRNFGVARKANHETAVDQPHVVLPSGADEFDSLETQVRKLLEQR